MTFMKLTFVLGAAAGLLALSACASDPAEAELAEAGGSPSDEVCRSVHEVGSRMAARVCKTRAEWDAESAAAREALERTGESMRAVPLVMGGPG